MNTPPASSRPYRADVDGLRAVAIVLVMLFHATNRCPGGFVGVDVFFVISGFLITGLLLDEQRRGGIRVGDFWLRRVRRLLPAAAAMVLAVLVAGFVLMVPKDYERLAKSAVAQQLLASNVFFSGAAGYFDASAELDPLLHTWSLAVEEQFYLVYPLLLALLGRLPRKWMAAALVAIAAASLAASDAGARAAAPWAFYLLPARAWEIMLGGLVCFAPPPRGRSSRLAEPLAALGLAGILVSAGWFDRTTPFPGRAALLPCLATAVLIYANSWTTTWTGRMLAMRPVVFVGLISYSLYLWHWPILAFLRYAWCDAHPGKIAKGMALAASFLLAVVSWRSIEVPFRRRTLLPRTRSLGIAAGGAVALLLAGAVVIVATNGLPARLGPQAAAYAAAKRENPDHVRFVAIDDVRQGTVPVCGADSGPATCMLWGDSHAMALVPGIDAACRARGIRCAVVASPATAPLLGFVARSGAGLNERGPAFARAVVDRAQADRVDVVVIAGLWAWYAEASDFVACLQATVGELSAAGIRVVLVRDVAKFPYDPALALFQASRLGRDVTKVGVTVGEHARANSRCDAAFDRLPAGAASVVDLAPALVDEAGLWRAEYDGVANYRDADHLSAAGGLRVQARFEILFDGLSAGR